MHGAQDAPHVWGDTSHTYAGMIGHVHMDKGHPGHIPAISRPYHKWIICKTTHSLQPSL